MTVGDELGVSGGAGSLVARYEDMEHVAGVVDEVADRLRTYSGQVAACAADGDMIAGGLLSPGTLADATLKILDAASGPEGLLVLSVRMEASALWVRTTITVYEAVDAAGAAAVEAMQDIAGFAAGLAVWGVVGGGVLLAAGVAVVGLAVAPGLVTSPGVVSWLADFGGDLGTAALGELEETLFEQPWLVDMLAGGAEGLLVGLTGPFGGEFAEAHGASWPPANFEEAVALLISGANLAGHLDDRPSTVTEITSPIDEETQIIPTGFAEIFTGQGQMMHHRGVDGEARQDHLSAGRIRVIQVLQPDGSSAWMVQLPGTQIADTVAGTNPMDMTSNVHMMASGYSGTMEAARSALQQAMDAAGVPTGQPVMLTGHSQGGIAAASLAADPSFRSEFNVTHVVTGGSPIARIDIPDSVQVLSMEHERDPIARLDGEPNPDAPNWTTVRRDHYDDAQGEVPMAAHGSTTYAQTGALVDASTDPSVAGFRESAAEFWTGDGQVRDYSIRREP